MPTFENFRTDNSGVLALLAQGMRDQVARERNTVAQATSLADRANRRLAQSRAQNFQGIENALQRNANLDIEGERTDRARDLAVTRGQFQTDIQGASDVAAAGREATRQQGLDKRALERRTFDANEARTGRIADSLEFEAGQRDKRKQESFRGREVTVKEATEARKSKEAEQLGKLRDADARRVQARIDTATDTEARLLKAQTAKEKNAARGDAIQVMGQLRAAIRAEQTALDKIDPVARSLNPTGTAVREATARRNIELFTTKLSVLEGKYDQSLSVPVGVRGMLAAGISAGASPRGAVTEFLGMVARDPQFGDIAEWLAQLDKDQPGLARRTLIQMASSARSNSAGR